MDADHTIRLRLEPGWSKLYLHCEHGQEMPWHGEYDEAGDVVAEMTESCWAAEWATEDGGAADEYLEHEVLGNRFVLDDVRLPFPVHAWFDGDSLRLTPVSAETRGDADAAKL